MLLRKKLICILSYDTEIDNRDYHVILELVGIFSLSTGLMRKWIRGEMSNLPEGTPLVITTAVQFPTPCLAS